MKRAHGIGRKIQFGGAILLVAVYLQEVLLTLSSITWRKDDDGLWHVLIDAAKVSKLWSFIGLMCLFAGLLVFLIGWMFKRRRRKEPAQPPRSRLTIYDMLVSYGWVGLLFFGGMLLYYSGFGLLIPEAFRNSSAGSAIGGVSMQLVAMAVIPIYFRKRLSEIGLRRPMITWKMGGYVLMFFVFTYAMSLVSAHLGTWIGVNTDSYREQHISEELHGALKDGLLLSLMPILATSLIAPVGEELLFRGVLQSVLTVRFGAVIGLVASAFLFALIHADVVLFLPIFCMGLLFGWLYRITGSLWAPIWLHMLNNLFASLMDLF